MLCQIPTRDNRKVRVRDSPMILPENLYLARVVADAKAVEEERELDDWR